MELRQLEYFVTVSEEANFTRAAQRLRVAQPAVSTQIQRLERELGQPLLDRSQRVVQLTAAGEAALPHAKAALAAVLDVQRAVDEVRQVVRGTIRIGTVLSHSMDLAALVADFHARYPAVEITLRTNDSDALIDALRLGQLDLAAVAIGAGERPEGIAVETVTDEIIGAVVSREHELASQSAITLQALRDVPLIALPAGTEIRRQLERACRRAGFVPHIAFEVSTPSESADLAALGLGVAIMRQSLSRERQDLHELSLRPELRAHLVVAWRAVGPINPAAQVLITMAQKAAASVVRAVNKSLLEHADRFPLGSQAYRADAHLMVGRSGLETS
jgi:DNA-binding transcriptional LysR family regulator